MKNRLQGILIGMIIGIVLSTAVFAAPITEWISVVYDDYKIVVNGKDKTSYAEDMRPFNLDGRTYVPLRYIAQTFGKIVEWEETTKTIYIDDADLVDFILSPSETLDAQTLSVAASTISIRLKNAGIDQYTLSIYDGDIIVSVPKDSVEKSDIENCIVEGYLHLDDSEGNTILDKSHIQNAYACYDDLTQSGILQHYVEIILTPEGQQILATESKKIAQKPNNQNYIAILIDDMVYSVPFVTEQIDADKIIITGYFTEKTAKEIAAVLTTGSLPCSFTIQDES